MPATYRAPGQPKSLERRNLVHIWLLQANPLAGEHRELGALPWDPTSTVFPARCLAPLATAANQGKFVVFKVLTEHGCNTLSHGDATFALCHLSPTWATGSACDGKISTDSPA